MPDDADQAQEIEEMLRANALAARRRVLERTGGCHNCEEPCEAVFCSVECREDYEARARVMAISGH